jgi:hypothetical protein
MRVFFLIKKIIAISIIEDSVEKWDVQFLLDMIHYTVIIQSRTCMNP